jgi:hypothetical protein
MGPLNVLSSDDGLEAFEATSTSWELARLANHKSL